MSVKQYDLSRRCQGGYMLKTYDLASVVFQSHLTEFVEILTPGPEGFPQVRSDEEDLGGYDVASGGFSCDVPQLALLLLPLPPH